MDEADAGLAARHESFVSDRNRLLYHRPDMRLVSTVVAVAALTQLALAQQPPPFRSSVNVVPVFATVLDATGAYAGGLTQDDFTVLDNGKPQEIQLFSSEAQAISVSVILDTSGSMQAALPRLFAAASVFLDNLRPDDRAMVGTLVYKGPPFTADKVRLRTSLDLLPVDPGSPVWASLDRSISTLGEESNRRVIVIYTDGKNSDLRTPSRPRGVTMPPAPTESSIRARVEADGVMIYAIGFEGASLSSGMKTVAARSGGRATELKQTDDLASALTAIADELHHQYLLGFKPAALDGRMHQIAVRIRPAGLTVRARANYLAQAR